MSSDKQNFKILILLFIGVLMGALDISIVGPALPSIEKTIRLTEQDLSWIFSIYVLFNLIGITFMARLSDVFGRRSIYIVALIIFGAGSLIAATSHNLTWLLIGRGIQGFGSSGIFPVALAVVGDLYPVEKRGRALGLIGAVFGLAFIMGPFIAGFMLRYYEWNSLFLINVPVVVLLVIFSFFMIPKNKQEGPVDFDWGGIILLGIILAAFTLAVNNIAANDFVNSISNWPVLPLLLAVLILTPILIMLEGMQKKGILNVHLFKSRQVSLVGVIAIGLGLFQSSIIFLPTIAVSSFGVTPSEAGFMLLPVVIASAIGSPVGGRLVDMIGSRWIIVAGLILSVAAFLIFGWFLHDRTMFYIGEALLGLGLAMRASLNYIILNEVSPLERASTQGMLIILISLGQLSGAALIGVMAAGFAKGIEGFDYAFIVMASLAGLLAILAFFLKSRKSEIGSII